MHRGRKFADRGTRRHNHSFHTHTHTYNDQAPSHRAGTAGGRGVRRRGPGALGSTRFAVTFNGASGGFKLYTRDSMGMRSNRFWNVAYMSMYEVDSTGTKINSRAVSEGAPSSNCSAFFVVGARNAGALAPCACASDGAGCGGQ